MSALINPRETLSLIVADFFRASFKKSGAGYHLSASAEAIFTAEGPEKIIQQGFLFLSSSHYELARHIYTDLGLNKQGISRRRYKRYEFAETFERMMRRESADYIHFLWRQRVQGATNTPMGGKYFYSDKDKDKWLVETAVVFFEAVSTYAWLVDRERVLLTVISNILLRREIEYAQNEEDRFARIVAVLETECRDKEIQEEAA